MTVGYKASVGFARAGQAGLAFVFLLAFEHVGFAHTGQARASACFCSVQNTFAIKRSLFKRNPSNSPIMSLKVCAIRRV